MAAKFQNGDRVRWRGDLEYEEGMITGGPFESSRDARGLPSYSYEVLRQKNPVELLRLGEELLEGTEWEDYPGEYRQFGGRCQRRIKK